MSVNYDRECHITKLKTRRLEKAFRRRPSPAAKSLWRAQFNQQRKLFQQKFVDHWSHKISSSKGNSKTMWSHLKCLLTQPEQTVTEHSPDDFVRHFREKNEWIRSLTAEFCHPTIVSRNVDIPLDVFEPVSVEEVATMIRKSPSNDPNSVLWIQFPHGCSNVCEYIAPIGYHCLDVQCFHSAEQVPR